jgi:hypothetical protein
MSRLCIFPAPGAVDCTLASRRSASPRSHHTTLQGAWGIRHECRYLTRKTSTGDEHVSNELKDLRAELGVSSSLILLIGAHQGSWTNVQLLIPHSEHYFDQTARVFAV